MIQKLKNYLWHWPKAVLASAWYGWPAKKLIFVGVTGTKGKTTTAHLIFHLLRKNGVKAGLISTIGAYFGDEEIDTGLHVTSPDPRELQRLLKMAVDKGLTHVVLEVTSSGLDQFRVWGIKFKAAVITNIYPDHLDYHGTMEKYAAAKLKIIRQAETVVVPNKFANFANLAGAKLKIVDFKKDSPVTLMNKKLAMAAAEVLGVPRVRAVGALRDFKGVKGRLEEVYKNKFSVVVDFAHTPESLAAALATLKREMETRKRKKEPRKRESDTKTQNRNEGRLIAVFGCAGERDHGRRRMGEVAAEMADFFVITAEDPRTEKVEEISEEIAGWARGVGAVEVTRSGSCRALPRSDVLSRRTSGCGRSSGVPSRATPHLFTRIYDRQEAINYAISMAKQGDVVGLFGKGHEKSMAFGKKELPWSEHEAVEKALKYVSISST